METDAFAIADCMGSLAMDGALGLWIRSVQICVVVIIRAPKQCFENRHSLYLDSCGCRFQWSPARWKRKGSQKSLGSLSRYIKPDIQTIAIGQAGAETQDVGTSLKEVYG